MLNIVKSSFVMGAWVSLLIPFSMRGYPDVGGGYNYIGPGSIIKSETSKSITYVQKHLAATYIAFMTCKREQGKIRCARIIYYPPLGFHGLYPSRPRITTEKLSDNESGALYNKLEKDYDTQDVMGNARIDRDIEFCESQDSELKDNYIKLQKTCLNDE